MVRKAVLYLRVSKKQQRKGYSLKAQEEALRKWIKELEYEIVEPPYEDTESGRTSTRRKAFHMMIDDAENDKFDAIFCWHNDRFSRRLRDAVDILEDLFDKHGVMVYFYNLKGLNIYDSQDKGVFYLMTWFAEHFSEQLGEKISMGLQKKMKKEWVGKAPFGYRVISDVVDDRHTNSRLRKNPEEHQVVKKIMRLHKTGRTPREIVMH